MVPPRGGMFFAMNGVDVKQFFVFATLRGWPRRPRGSRRRLHRFFKAKNRATRRRPTTESKHTSPSALLKTFFHATCTRCTKLLRVCRRSRASNSCVLIVIRIVGKLFRREKVSIPFARFDSECFGGDRAKCGDACPAVGVAVLYYPGSYLPPRPTPDYRNPPGAAAPSTSRRAPLFFPPLP